MAYGRQIQQDITIVHGRITPTYNWGALSILNELQKGIWRMWDDKWISVKGLPTQTITYALPFFTPGSASLLLFTEGYGCLPPTSLSLPL